MRNEARRTTANKIQWSAEPFGATGSRQRSARRPFRKLIPNLEHVTCREPTVTSSRLAMSSRPSKGVSFFGTGALNHRRHYLPSRMEAARLKVTSAADVESITSRG